MIAPARVSLASRITPQDVYQLRYPMGPIVSLMAAVDCSDPDKAEHVMEYIARAAEDEWFALEKNPGAHDDATPDTANIAQAHLVMVVALHRMLLGRHSVQKCGLPDEALTRTVDVFRNDLRALYEASFDGRHQDPPSNDDDDRDCRTCMFTFSLDACPDCGARRLTAEEIAALDPVGDGFRRVEAAGAVHS